MPGATTISGPASCSLRPRGSLDGIALLQRVVGRLVDPPLPLAEIGQAIAHGVEPAVPLQRAQPLALRPHPGARESVEQEKSVSVSLEHAGSGTNKQKKKN